MSSEIIDRHYTLSWRYGYYASPGEEVTHIGQASGCEVRLPEDPDYLPELIANIEPCNEGSEWRLIRKAPEIAVSVNGSNVHRVCYLKDGDKILIEGCIITFRIKEGVLAQGISTTSASRMPSTISLLLIGLAVAMLMWFTFSTDHNRLTDEEIAEATQSLIRIEVDSLALFQGDSLIENYCYTSHPIGTGFVTSDSLLVTARHCINPWLNSVAPTDFAEIPNLADRPISMALRCETANRLSDSDEFRLITYLTLTDVSGRKRSVSSESFKIDDSRDEIVELGDYQSDYFWRSISRRYGRSDMMLGDVAIMPLDTAGFFVLASKEQMDKSLHKRTPLTFLGFPMSEGTNEESESETDELRQPLTPLESDSSTLSMLAHGSRLTPGYSGGPVLFVEGSRILVGGVISVLDSRNGHRSYSVPASQVNLLKDKSK